MEKPVCHPVKKAKEKPEKPATWGPFTALGACLRQYSQSKGRASRKEFWYAVLGNSIICTIFHVLIAAGVLLSNYGDYNVTTCIALTSIISFLYLLYLLFFTIPSVALLVRRLHDAGRSTSNICYYFIPIVGPIILLYFLLSPSTSNIKSSANANQWGPFSAIASSLRRYAQFDGRASRSEFWYAVLGDACLHSIFAILTTIGFFVCDCLPFADIIIIIYSILCGLLLLAVQGFFLTPKISLLVRRLHDTGRSGAAACFYFIPVAGPFILLYFLVSASGVPNQFGESPSRIADKTEGLPFINSFLSLFEFSSVAKDPNSWGPFKAIASALRKYAQFNGRASRQEFWYAVLGHCIINIIFALYSYLLFEAFFIGELGFIGILVFVIVLELIHMAYMLFFMVPNLALVIRRLHDTGRSGNAFWFYFIPLAGPFILLTFLASPSTPENQFGASPEGIADKSQGGKFINGFISFFAQLQHPILPNPFGEKAAEIPNKSTGGTFIKEFLAACSFIHKTWKHAIACWCGFFLICWFILWLVTPPYFATDYIDKESEFGQANREYRRGDIEITDYPFVSRFRHTLEKSGTGFEENAAKEMLKIVKAGGNADDAIPYCSANTEAMVKLFEISEEACKNFEDYNLDNHNVDEFIKLEQEIVGEREVNTKLALVWAVARGNADLVRYIIDKYPDLDINYRFRIDFTKLSYGEHTALECAAAVNNPECLDLLLSVPSVDVNINRPLRSAAKDGHVECVKRLLEAPGTDVNKQQALTAAAYSGQTEIVKLLLTVPSIDVNLGLPLIKAVENNHTECVKLLLQHGADPNLKNHKGETALRIAVNNAYNEIVTELVKAPGIDVNHREGNQRNLLYLAVINNQPNIVKSLLEASGIDPNITEEIDSRNSWTSELKTPLYAAAEQGYTEIVKIFLTNSSVDVNKESPLYIAAKNGHAQIVQLLLDAPGIDINNGNRSYTPLEKAKTEEIKQLIQDSKNKQGFYTITAKASVTAYKVEEAFYIALNGKVADSYHAYWRNPGSIGEPVTATLKAPDGFNVEGPYWTVPNCITGNVSTVYAYKAPIAVWKVTPAATAPQQATFTIESTAQTCNNEGCNSPETKATTVNLAAGSGTANSSWENAETKVEILGDTQVSLTATQTIQTVTLTIKGIDYISKAYFFSDDNSIKPTGKQTLTKTADGYTLALPRNDNSDCLHPVNDESTVNQGLDSLNGLLTFDDKFVTVKLKLDNTPRTYVDTPSQSTPDYNKLGVILQRIQCDRYRDSTQQLYQKRLLMLIPLIMQGNSPSVTTPETKGNTALHYACCMGDVELVFWLVTNGADTEAVTNKGATVDDCVGGRNAEAIHEILKMVRQNKAYSLPYNDYEEDDDDDDEADDEYDMDADEAFQIGVNYQFGKNGYSKNLREAVRYYTIAAEQGHAKGQNNLGHMYNEGWGVTANKQLAFYWYGEAAKQGLPLAQSNYGTCFEFGTGTPKNKAKAIEWYRKAAAQGNQSALKHLKRLKVIP